MQYCAVCLIARDENKYIREWAEYPLRIGFDALIIYDNQSVVPLRETLADYVALGRVTVHDHADDPSGWGATQGNAYADCMQRYRDAFKWIAVIDADEFLFPKKTPNIKEFLAEYECYGAVAAHWVFFGSSGLARNDTGSQIFAFINTANEESTTIKSIVQPRRVKDFRGPHGADLLPGHFAVSSDHFPLEPCVYSAPFVNDAIQVNHYHFRSWDEFMSRSALKKAKWDYKPLTPEQEKAAHTGKDFGIIKFYSAIQANPIGRNEMPPVPASVSALVEEAMGLLENGRHAALELLLCHAALVFADEPLIWMLRAISSRVRGNVPRALHCIREASKLSGSSSVYFELARVYAAMGEKDKAARAQRQAAYKKQVEDATCAP